MDSENNKKNKTGIVATVGRRKEAVARVRLLPGNGRITVNGKPIAEYFLGQVFQKLYNRPLELTKTIGKYSFSVRLEGGGKVAQLEAIIHGIARALSKAEPALRVTLKKEGFLTRDARVKERRKYGHAQKARAKKQSPKR
ncbi:30S ribosomal protein S9 [Candidatus Daviesbacteria bacterium RIFCSPHIGHO2_02_FULL_39_12]|uniref:30S ribosomal protein S9 n=2 Tax=Candidatus Daviesiibacteriota TaxID=1752718 RepID=A0A1F5JD11_9BACT|nr:MAG: 30S ribosomal protein S9 [Candidatus Daviesbacteria bacterium RIFCSPHIGHO2_02_FULL_39_12]OGE72620.1 MAG: 30S ribosomal protein S9 [Candidatus Daviesbacteria bacterium RIFCSPLOWO2_02_FULL_38_15]